jgi:hypothetical protein
MAAGRQPGYVEIQARTIGPNSYNNRHPQCPTANMSDYTNHHLLHDVGTAGTRARHGSPERCARHLNLSILATHTLPHAADVFSNL